ncbi:MAG: hypothetical protein QOJ63_3284 [Solirubrobacteraceae bacterium]|jgi:hypothetical protein|nr:hypothetical protein [Solirubrobacteraceae bacterium]
MAGRRSGALRAVFDFLLGNAEVVGDVREVIAGHESIDEIRDARTAMDEQR